MTMEDERKVDHISDNQADLVTGRDQGHPGRTYICTVCCKVCEGYLALKFHMQNAHGIDLPYNGTHNQ